MKHAIELFSELGRRLRAFGDDEPSQRAIERACRENSWFTPSDIRRAIGAIVEDMLDRARLEAWLEAYPVPVKTPRKVEIVMAGNIPAVGFFDLLCVVASGHRCRVKPSSKDRALMEYLIGQLREIDPSVAIAPHDDEAAIDAVIATGGDNAVRYFRTHYAGIPALLRGSRHSVAVLSGDETPAELEALADDIWAYSGLGCRSVSLLWLPRGYEPQLRMPPVLEKYRNNYRQTRALLAMNGRTFVDLGASVAVEQQEFPLSLSTVAYARYDTLAEAETWLAEHDGELQCVVTRCAQHPRRVDFGRAQHPGLTDYADAKDVMGWLSTL